VDHVDPDLLHVTEPNDLLWSRVNFEEAMPGVLTPLTWTFWGWVTEHSSQRIYVERFGAFAKGELSGSLADATAALFHGRAAVNVDLLRRVLDRVPGADPDALELQVLGRVREGATSSPTWRRAPHVLARAPWNVAMVPRRVRRLRAEVDTWWRTATASDPATLEACGALLLEARQRFLDVASDHGFNVFIGQAGYDRLAKLAIDAGHPGLELALSASGEGTEETAMITDLWAAAQGTLPVDEIVARHGYHGPDEGQISSWSWREDRAPLLGLLERYRSVGAPRTSATREERAGAEARLLAGLPRTKRALARGVLRFVDTYLPLREVGKAAFLQCIDVGRHAAHAAGRHLVAQGRLADVDDVRFLTVDELVAGTVDGAAVERRRARREELLAVDLPDSFVGVPDAWPIASASAPASASADGIVRGLAAGGGRHKGVARLVRDPDDYGKLEDGDVLVCELTDPGWTPLFAVAGAVVIDIGGPLSHGAIVARELGIPCVIGTGDGTRRIPDGAVVEVDGDRGEVHPC
jgi:phosphohistidine swiveling domain-containing protein